MKLNGVFNSISPFLLSFTLIASAGCIIISQTGCKFNKKADESPTLVFQKIQAQKSGIHFNNIVEENYKENFFDAFAYVYNGGGVGIGDFNNDGLQDIYFTGNNVSNKLYLNKGNFKFKDITESAGVDGGKGWCNGVTIVDINNDGWADIYICKGGFENSTPGERRNLLYINQGNLTFKEEAKKYGLDDTGYSVQSVFFDMDNDGDLDLYLANRPDKFFLGLSQVVSGKRNPPDDFRDKLYRNDDGNFIEISKQAGVGNGYGYPLGVVTADLNGDGFDDIYVANDYADNDYMYINQKNGTFQDKIKIATHHNSLSSMGADIADINNDGLEDILVLDMLPEDYIRSKTSSPPMDFQSFWAIVDSGFHKQYTQNILHLNQGNLFFSDISQLAGISKTEWSWSVLACDFDNDGKRDIFVSNGYWRDLFDGDIGQRLRQNMEANASKYNSKEEYFTKNFKEFIQLYKQIKVRNYIFQNKGDLRFENVSKSWGFTDSTFSNGAAVGDFDNDGDLDLVINNLNEEASLYENITSKNNHFIKVKLHGPDKNRDGIGAKVSIYYDGNKQQFFQQKTVRGYLSSNESILHFGLGKVENIDSITVEWPGGKRNTVTHTGANQTLGIDYANAITKIDSKQTISVLFKEQTNQLFSQKFVHKENTTDEYKDQRLLPHEFSKSGPFVAVGDVNGDGHEDFYVGGASGQAGALYLQVDSKFVKQTVSIFEKDNAYEDMGCVFFDANNDGYPDLYVVSGGSEYYEGSPMYQDRLYFNDGQGNFTKCILLPTTSSGSCIAVYDLDGDGYLDLFRGGQVVPHQYPYPPRSYIFLNNKGTFIDKTMEIGPELSKAGMVNSVVWADLNGDKINELIVAGEWMPIKVFEFSQNKLNDVSSRYGLDSTHGWWNKLLADDIDGDGDIDIIAGNLGENYKFKASKDSPFSVYAKDFDENGTNDIFLAECLSGKEVPVRGPEIIFQQYPLLSRKFPTYLSFAKSDMKGILGNELQTALHYKAFLFSSVILENDKGKFTIKKLPVEAQFSTVNGIIANDFDGDGVRDLLIAGNKFEVEVETTPADASPGFFLKGQENLHFKTYKPLESGFFVPYNVKDIKLINIKGGEALLVGTNNDLLRVFTKLK